MKKATKQLLSRMQTVPRTWLKLPTLDMYILREFMIKFSILIFVCIIIFMLNDVFRDLSDFLDADAPLGSTILYFFLKLPGNLSFVLPISVLLGCMWTMAMFGKNLEVTAMRASGLSLMRCGRAIFVVGFLVSLLNIWFNEQLAPKYNEQAGLIHATMTDSSRHADDSGKMLTFKSFDKNRTWLFRSFDEEGVNYGVTLKFFRNDESLEKYLSAEKATFDPKAGWLFDKVTITPFSTGGFLPKPPITQESMQFSLDAIPEDPHTISVSVRNAAELPCWTIFDILMNTENMAKRSSNIYWTIFFYRLAFPWASLIAVFLGVPLATKNERSGIMLAVISAVVVIVAFIVISEAFKLFGMQGVIPPVIAGLMPTLAFITYGWWNVYRNRT